jgi:hypothetical protein
MLPDRIEHGSTTATGYVLQIKTLLSLIANKRRTIDVLNRAIHRVALRLNISRVEMLQDGVYSLERDQNERRHLFVMHIYFSLVTDLPTTKPCIPNLLSTIFPQ